jgi:ribosome maturation factor RimP
MNVIGSIESVVTSLGYDLVDVERSAGGLLRVSIDRIPGRSYSLALGEGEFVTIDDCEDYVRLEVSSPGLDRPLRREADYQRFCGQEVDITLKAAFKGRKHWRGVIQPALANATPEDESRWSLALGGELAGQVLDFSLAEVREARLVPVIDFKGRRRAQPAQA